jgi:hypothetical protein
MKYEATIYFEVKDETVDLTHLLGGRTLDVHGVELIGRTDDGEVVSGMEMGWGGEVDWTDEAKVRIAKATKRDQPTTGGRGRDRQSAVGKDE